jgi:hypothetical protein
MPVFSRGKISLFSFVSSTSILATRRGLGTNDPKIPFGQRPQPGLLGLIAAFQVPAQAFMTVFNHIPAISEAPAIVG